MMIKLINSYLAFFFFHFSMTTLLQLGVYIIYNIYLFQYILVFLSTLFIFDRFSRQDQFAVYIFRFNLGPVYMVSSTRDNFAECLYEKCCPC